jgi:imidazolonepropionase
MLIHSAHQLLTITSIPQRGTGIGDIGLIEDGAVIIDNGKIVSVGTTDEMHDSYQGDERIDASGKVVIPGIVDPHTHACWMGDRSREFEMRLQGKTYMEIMQAGGGIISTVQKTRAASVEELVDATRPRLERIFMNGTTTVEIKTGYGLDSGAELRMLEAILKLDEELPMDIVPTFLGAHAFPPEYKDDHDGYVDLVVDEMLPAVDSWWSSNSSGREKPFVDVFCETGAFSLEQTKRILTAASELSFPLKVHSDEFDNLSGTSLAAELGAVSADHLVVTSKEDMKALGKSDTVAVSLPCTPFGLAEGHYTPAWDILHANGILAIATDMNPGTAWCESMQFAIALSCRYLKLTPAQAIVASTINAAAAINKQELVGSLQPGKQADLLILDIPDYRHLGYRFGSNLVQTVIKRGIAYPVT